MQGGPSDAHASVSTPVHAKRKLFLVMPNIRADLHDRLIGVAWSHFSSIS